jgi:lipopolysaccharide biosynthesis protein
MRALLIYAHFHPDNQVESYVLHTLRHFLAQGFDVIFASTSPVSATDTLRLQAMGVRLMQVENIGYDFYAWRSAIVDPQTCLEGYDRLVLLNSSVHGPFFDLKAFISNLEERDADVIGATQSLEIRPHVQSYFFYFKASAIQSSGFKRYWQAFVPYADRQGTIDNHELRITDHLTESGLRVAAFYTSSEKSNPSLAQVDRLYAARLPFLKYSKMHRRKHFILRLKLRCRACLLNCVQPKTPSFFAKN